MFTPHCARARPPLFVLGILLACTSAAAALDEAAIDRAYVSGSASSPHAAGPVVLATALDIRPRDPAPGAFSPVEVNRIMAHIRRQEFDEALKLATAMTQASPKESTGFKLQGAAWFGKGDLFNARKSFDIALRLSPNDPQALVYLAQLDVKENNPASARKRYETILGTDPKYAPAMIGLAQIEVAAKNDKGAATWFEKARDADPKALLPRLYLGSYYLQTKDLAAATAEANEANRLFPDNPEALDLLARVQLASGLDSQAVRTLRQLVSVTPNALPARMRLATAQIKVGDAAGAAASLRAVLQQKPDSVDAAYMLAALDVKAGRNDEALKLAKGLQTTMAGSPVGFAIEGDVLAVQRKYAEAQQAYERAFAISKTTTIAIKLHEAQQGAGRGVEANARLLEWLNAHPDDMEGWQYLAGVYAKNGQRKAAIEQYERLVKANPKNALALNNLAALYQSEKDPRALATAEQAYALAPDSPVAADTLGWIQIEQGNAARGLELVRKALDRDPKNTELRYHAAVGLARSGSKAEARRELEKLLAGNQPFEQRQAATDLLKQL